MQEGRCSFIPATSIYCVFTMDQVCEGTEEDIALNKAVMLLTSWSLEDNELP